MARHAIQEESRMRGGDDPRRLVEIVDRALQDSFGIDRCLEVEVTSQGETVDEALANLREALELYFEDDEVPASFAHPLVTPIEICISA